MNANSLALHILISGQSRQMQQSIEPRKAVRSRRSLEGGLSPERIEPKSAFRAPHREITRRLTAELERLNDTSFS